VHTRESERNDSLSTVLDTEVLLVDRHPTAWERIRLRRAVGWRTHDPAAVEESVDGAVFGVCAEVGGQAVGMVRVVGDGRTCFYVHEVIVHPEYQGMGVGRRLMDRVMEHVAENACRNAFVALIAEEGKEGFYEPFGFLRLPCDGHGSGMERYWER